MSKLYLDGDSGVYGLGLSKEYSLGSLLSADIDMSSPNKSNFHIAHDVYKAIDTADTFIIVFTVGDRITLWNNNVPIGISPPKTSLESLDHPQSGMLEQEYKSFHKMYYTLYNISYTRNLNNFLVDGTVALLKSKNKKFLICTFEKRQCISKEIFYISHVDIKLKTNCLPTDHFNEEGMQMLANLIKEKL